MKGGAREEVRSLHPDVQKAFRVVRFAVGFWPPERHFFFLVNCSFSVEPSMLRIDDRPPVATCVTSSK